MLLGTSMLEKQNWKRIGLAVSTLTDGGYSLSLLGIYAGDLRLGKWYATAHFPKKNKKIHGKFIA